MCCGAPASKAIFASKEGRQEFANMNVELLQSISKDGRANLNTVNWYTRKKKEGGQLKFDCNKWC